MKDVKVFHRKKKKIEQQYGHEQYKNLPKDENQRLIEYRILQNEKKCLTIISFVPV